jgi:hypothetical protein
MDDIIIQGLTRDPSSIIELKKYIDAEYFDNCISRVPVAIKYIFPTKYTKSASPIELSFMYECFRTYNEHYIEFVSTLRSIPQKAFGPSLVNFLMTYPELHPIDTAYITYRFIPPNLCNVNLLKIAIKSATNAFGDDISEDYDPVSQMGIALNTKRITSEMLTAPGVYESLHKLINIGIKKEGEEDKSSDDEYIDPRKVMAKLNKWSSDLK